TFLFDPSLSNLMGAVEAPDEVRQAVRSNLAHNVDWIKVFATGSGGPGQARQPALSEAAMRAAVEEAATKNIPVFAHSHTDEGTMAAVRAGVRVIEHGTLITDTTLEFMKEKGTYFDPTLVSEIDFADHGGDNNNVTAQLNYEPLVRRLEYAI